MFLCEYLAINEAKHNCSSKWGENSQWYAYWWGYSSLPCKMRNQGDVHSRKNNRKGSKSCKHSHLKFYFRFFRLIGYLFVFLIAIVYNCLSDKRKAFSKSYRKRLMIVDNRIRDQLIVKGKASSCWGSIYQVYLFLEKSLWIGILHGYHLLIVLFFIL